MTTPRRHTWRAEYTHTDGRIFETEFKSAAHTDNGLRRAACDALIIASFFCVGETLFLDTIDARSIIISYKG